MKSQSNGTTVRLGDTISSSGATYRVRGYLGRGGMAQVLDVEDHTLGKRFALKLLDAHLASDPPNVERFEREARALARLDHPHIVSVVRLERTREPLPRPFFLMERLRGGTLRDHLNRGAISPSRVLAVAEQLCRALHYVHERGLLHRDVKPSNVFLHVDAFGVERVKLLDFGVMKLLHEGAGGTSLDDDGFYGTAHYAAPEQLVQGAPLGPETDVYAAGIVLFEALTGQHPFADAERTIAGARAARRRGAPCLGDRLRPRGVEDSVLGELAPLVASMLCRNPLGRPSAGTVARALARSLRLAKDRPAEVVTVRTKVPDVLLPGHLAAPTEVDEPPPPPPETPPPQTEPTLPVSDAELEPSAALPLVSVPNRACPPPLAAWAEAGDDRRAQTLPPQASRGRTRPLRPSDPMRAPRPSDPARPAHQGTKGAHGVLRAIVYMVLVSLVSLASFSVASLGFAALKGRTGAGRALIALVR